MSKLDLITKQIRKLAMKEQARLFDRLQNSLEDYLLAKIAESRLKTSSNKRIPWGSLPR